MDNEIKNLITEKIVNPTLSSNFGFNKAEVLYYDNFRNRATIRLVDKNVGKLELENVPIQISGFISNNISVGDLVDVMFINNSPLLPKIIGKCDEGYELYTRESIKHLKQGCLITDNINNVNIEEELEPLSEQWIDLDNTNNTKYFEYMNKDVEDEAFDLITSLGYYNKNEIGFTNPFNKSTIKVDNHGNILLFNGTNNGIKINLNNSSIDITTNDLNVSCSNININTKSLIINGKEMI